MLEWLLENMLNNVAGADLIQTIKDSVTLNWFGAAGGDALSAVQTLYGVIQPVSIMLIFIYFMIAVVDKLSSENFTWEQLCRQMALLMAAYYLITHCFEILELLFNIGIEVTESVYNSTSADGGNINYNAEEMIKGFREAMGMDGFLISIIADVIMVVFLIIPWVISWVMSLAVSIICYSRVIEIYVRATFAPLAISDFFHSGLQSGGFRFLKNFLAVSLQGALILVIAVIYSKLFSTIIVSDTNLFTFTGKYLAFYASSIMLMFKSLSLSKEIVGTS